jgi:hypothetical protein
MVSQGDRLIIYARHFVFHSCNLHGKHFDPSTHITRSRSSTTITFVAESMDGVENH